MVNVSGFDNFVYLCEYRTLYYRYKIGKVLKRNILRKISNIYSTDTLAHTENKLNLIRFNLA